MIVDPLAKPILKNALKSHILSFELRRVYFLDVSYYMTNMWLGQKMVVECQVSIQLAYFYNLLRLLFVSPVDYMNVYDRFKFVIDQLQF